jgi:PAS domain S-box-containing protein
VRLLFVTGDAEGDPRSLLDGLQNPAGFLRQVMLCTDLLALPQFLTRFVPDLILVAGQAGSETVRRALETIQSAAIQRPVLVLNGETDACSLGTLLQAFEQSASASQEGESGFEAGADRYHVILNTSPDAIAVTDARGTIEEANQACAALSDYETPQELAGRSIFDFVVPEDLPQAIDDFKRLLDEKRSMLEYRMLRRDGLIIFVEISVSVIADQNGCITHLIAVLRDTTLRRDAEEKLRISESRFHSLFANMFEGVALHEFVLGENGVPLNYRIVDCNPSYERILGVKSAEIAGRLSTEVYQTDIPPYLAEFSSCLEVGPLYFTTYFAPLQKHFSISVVPWGQEGFATIFWDVTEQKTAEAEIHVLNQSLEQRILALTQPIGDVSHLRLEDIFDLDMIQKVQDAFARATGVASIITDTDGVPITRPSNFCYLCEHIIRQTDKGLQNCYHSDAVLGKVHAGIPIMQPCLSGGLWDGGTSIMVGERHIANWLIGQILEEPVDQEKMLTYAREIGADEVEFHRALGQVKRMSRAQFEDVCNALYVIAEQLSVLAVQNVQQAQFIAERKKSEEAIRQLNNELEKRVRERTAQLEATNHELEAFAYTVSHDLRSPLRAIDGFSRILEEDYSQALDGTGREHLLRIRRGAQRMDGLIDSLLSLSRLTRAEVRRSHLDLSVLARQVAEDLQEGSPQRNILWTIAPELEVDADPNLMRVILENLLGNAVKFTARRAEAHIEVGSYLKGQETVFFVRDDGAGFDMAYAGKLFGVFQRLHDPKEFSGNGIGLATVQRIVHRHGGRVWAEGAPEQGATVSFVIPAN